MDTPPQVADVPPEAMQAAARVDELHFNPSLEPTIGVEVELQILDRETGDLTPGAVRTLKACHEEKVEGVVAELMQSMIEVKTGICANVDEAREQLFTRIHKVRNIASSLGYELALAGTHPFHRTTGSTVFPDERYERILDRLAWLAYQRVMFGLHVHVGVPSGDIAIGVINLMVQYVPHLIALSANSPFWQGVDTGLASSRVALYRLLPHAGLPLYFGNWKEFRNYCKVMKDCKTIDSFKDIYWDIRPRPDFGTIEFRICDIPMTITETLRLVALIRALTVSCIRLLQGKPRSRGRDIRRHWIAVENKWLATRYGMNALYIRTPTGKRRTLASDLADLIDRMIPIARELGDEKYLTGFKPVDKIETGATRQRQHYRDKGNWKGLTDFLVQQLLNDLGIPLPTGAPGDVPVEAYQG
ncbi:MAG: YbdK family carboxylate-amine ligase [Planctomycetes bacterium]|nr:YbdK family carboxylate-amine ligase [Planctomycetota bacterium]